MYTVLWREGNNDRWDRFSTAKEVCKLLDELAANPDVCEHDVWIFSPKADEYAFDYGMFDEDFDDDEDDDEYDDDYED